jgi:hypothetical protein
MVPDCTNTYPPERRRYQSGVDLITALGVLGTDIVLPMLSAQFEFTLGRAATCDLRVDRKYLASIHARIERIPISSHATLRVTDVSSGKNDIVYNEIAAKEFTLAAGEWFQIGETRYYALNEEMRLAWPRVMEILGVRNIAATSDLLVAAVRDSARHVVLLGEPGSEQERLGRLIHQVSHRRHNQFHPLPELPKLNGTHRDDLQDAGGGTVLVPLYRRGKLDDRLVEMLTHPAADLRLIICARTPDKVDASFPSDRLHAVKQIKIPPLRQRKNDIPELLNQWFIARHSSLRFPALRQELRDGIMAHTWPGNLRELRALSGILLQLASCRTVGEATGECQVSRGTLRGWAKQLNTAFEFPLVVREATTPTRRAREATKSTSRARKTTTPTRRARDVTMPTSQSREATKPTSRSR